MISFHKRGGRNLMEISSRQRVDRNKRHPTTLLFSFFFFVLLSHSLSIGCDDDDVRNLFNPLVIRTKPQSARSTTDIFIYKYIIL